MGGDEVGGALAGASVVEEEDVEHFGDGEAGVALGGEEDLEGLGPEPVALAAPDRGRAEHPVAQVEDDVGVG